jgi:hypothetical protein
MDAEEIGLLEAQLAACRKALIRVRQGYANILEFRKLCGFERYGAFTREEIKQCISDVDATLATSDPQAELPDELTDALCGNLAAPRDARIAELEAEVRAYREALERIGSICSIADYPDPGAGDVRIPVIQKIAAGSLEKA